MKNIKYLLMVATLLFVVPGCKKFLNVTPIDALSGNNFWQTKQDVEGFTNGIYSRLKSKIGGNVMMPALDIRGNFVKVVGTIESDGNNVFNRLISNNLKPIVTATTTYDNRLKTIMNWDAWYDIIAASNILYVEVDKVPSTSLSDHDKKRYKAEAVFMRNLSYMFLCKLFGDAIYYTEAYHSKALARTPQLEVMKKCIADMNAAKNDLPTAYTESSLIGFRPTKASAVALLMHLNMWAAAWETKDKTDYYRSVLTLAEEMATYTNYYLLPINTSNTMKIFKGRTAENLFGVLQDYNYGETFAAYAGYSYFFSHYPYRGSVTKTTSFMTYEKDYINKLFPSGSADERLSAWFENYNADNNTFQFKKFINVYATGSGSNLNVNSDDSAIIFRLPDALLLAAEAAAELDDDLRAQGYVNQVRSAASATAFTSSGQTLKDDIYAERCRELIGEGHFFFDLVRTKRAVNTEYTKNPISVGNFNSGAWTWPLTISATERAANPKLVGNTYWN
ncbi:RagB/SusD family nutrient uptake outer membrane protein [Pedobacter nyackensis]|uniref:Starch-binding associating with outer membrane n=1 Tax=Pedobacter nyackensis TaxID=475255 RepID=A0A1W2AFB0_9SPHI|nr:RagB/SusD family nutrient uptake outer membrane protein [Pedobacter nyackensis]SMC59141.1 Starch-binding associating with outer membrane [Pedobacter nyackensis]